MTAPAGGGAVEAENYAARLAKYIPAEVIALYTALLGIALQRIDLVKWAFFVAWVATPIYLLWATRDANAERKPVWTQVILATIAFPIWALAMGSPAFTSELWGDRQTWSFILVGATAAFGFAKPPAAS